MPQSTHSRKVLGEFWEILTCPRLGRAPPKFTGYLESSAQVYLKLSLGPAPSFFSSLLPHA